MFAIHNTAEPWLAGDKTRLALRLTKRNTVAEQPGQIGSRIAFIDSDSNFLENGEITMNCAAKT